MTDSRPARIWGLVAERAASRGSRVTTADACTAAVDTVEVTGAWLAAISDGDAGHVLHVTDAIAELLAELQLTLGEGPAVDAVASGGPVLSSDLDTVEMLARWPGFAPAARLAGAAAVFAFPLQVGAIRAGVLGLYRDQPGALSSSQLGDALLFADTATLLLLDAQAQAADSRTGDTGPAGQTDLARHRAQVDQATGMLTEQLGTTIADAFARLRAYAYSHDLRLSDVARDIVARRLRLHPDPDASLDGER